MLHFFVAASTKYVSHMLELPLLRFSFWFLAISWDHNSCQLETFPWIHKIRCRYLRLQMWWVWQVTASDSWAMIIHESPRVSISPPTWHLRSALQSSHNHNKVT